MLLTRSPLYSSAEADFLARLACVRRAASVDSEPGSNSRCNSPSCAIASYPAQTRDELVRTRHFVRLNSKSLTGLAFRIVKELSSSSRRCDWNPSRESGLQAGDTPLLAPKHQGQLLFIHPSRVLVNLHEDAVEDDRIVRGWVTENRLLTRAASVTAYSTGMVMA